MAGPCGRQLLWNHWGHAWPARLELTDVQRTLLERVAELTITNPPHLLLAPV